MQHLPRQSRSTILAFPPPLAVADWANGPSGERVRFSGKAAAAC